MLFHVVMSCRQNEPDLFSNLVVQFYYVPLSVSTFTRGEDSSSSKKKDSALPEYMLEHSQNSLVGEDVWLACYLSQFDSWYERNVLLAVHNALRIIPVVSGHGGGGGGGGGGRGRGARGEDVVFSGLHVSASLFTYVALLLLLLLLFLFLCFICCCLAYAV